MRASEYENIFKNEETHGWYLGMKSISFQLLEKYLSKKNGLKILDAGCGAGIIAFFLEKYGKVFGIDNSSLAVAFCLKRKLKNISQASVVDIPFKSKNFDLVTSFDVLCTHNLDYKLAIKEFSRVLKPGGVLLIRVPAFEFLRGGHDVVVHSGHRFTRNELVSIIKKAGFKVKFASYANFFLFLPILLVRIFSRVREAKSDVSQMPKPANFFLEKILLLEGKIIKFISLPFGVSLFVVAARK